MNETEGKVGETNAGRDDARSALRCRDRGKDEAWVREFMTRAPYGFLAKVGEGGQPLLNSNLFVYNAARHCIDLNTHRTGHTRENFAASAKVAFSAVAIGRLLPAPETVEFSIEYAGVVAFGPGRGAEDSDEAKAALQALLDKYAPHLVSDRDYRSTTDEELTGAAFYRIDVETWSGKQKEVDADFSGAFDLPKLTIPFPDRTPVQ